MAATVAVPLSMAVEPDWFQSRLVERLVRYVRVHTTSDPASESTPSTAGQWDLARLLEQEMQELGLDDVKLDDHCNLMGRLRGTPSGTPIGFLAHLDTAPDFSGDGVKPQVHHDYDGSPIDLGEDHLLDPDVYPILRNYLGQTIITTDGTTLLGADDKAGIAEIMTMVEYLLGHPELPRPDLEIAFTPDEEIGRGLQTFPVEELRSKFCFTLDGTDEGGIEAECFTGYSVQAEFTGYSIHPGSARGKLANAASMAAQFVAGLPRTESPEATDGRYGFYCPTSISGSIASAKVGLILRDFDMHEVERRIEYVKLLARTVEAAFPGGAINLAIQKQYLNMGDFLKPFPEVIEFMEEAVRLTGMEPHVEPIRGGTDGAKSSERGVPTPNIFTGGQNLHGRYEWIAASAMERATKSALHLCQFFAERSPS